MGEMSGEERHQRLGPVYLDMRSLWFLQQFMSVLKKFPEEEVYTSLLMAQGKHNEHEI